MAGLRSEVLCFASEQHELAQTQFKNYRKEMDGSYAITLKEKGRCGAEDICLGDLDIKPHTEHPLSLVKRGQGVGDTHFWCSSFF